MALTVSHPFVSAKPDGVDSTLIQPTNWNATHSITGTQDVANGGTGANNAGDARTNLGLGSIATQAASSVAITGGAISGVTITSLDSNTTFQDDVDPTKQMQFQLSGLSGGVTRALTVQDASGTVALTSNKLSAFAATTSAELAGVVSDETGTGALVFANTPTLVTPVLGAATATSINGNTWTAGTGTLTLGAGSTLATSATNSISTEKRPVASSV